MPTDLIFGDFSKDPTKNPECFAKITVDGLDQNDNPLREELARSWTCSCAVDQVVCILPGICWRCGGQVK